MDENIITVDSLDNFKLLKPLVRYIKQGKGFIAGGCFKNIFNNIPCKDIDVFFESVEDFNEALSEYERSELFSKLYENDNCIAFKEKNTNTIVELIRKSFSNPQNTIKKFDFTITKFALQKHVDEIDGETNITYTLYYHKDFFEHLFMKRIVIDENVITFPLSTFQRIIKYIGYGYTPCFETKKKIVNAIHDIAYLDFDEMGKSFYSEGFD